MLANLITSLRIIFGIIMMFFAYLGNTMYFVVSYCFVLLTDLLDGYVARKFNLVSEFGKKFDALSDNFIVICVAISFYFFKLDLIMKYLPLGLFLLSYFVIVQIISLLITKKLIFMRNYSALLAAIVFPIVVIMSLFFESRILIYSYIIIMIYSLTEKLFLQMANKNKRSVFYLKSQKIKLVFVILLMILITLVFFIPLTDNNAKVCFDDGFCVNVEIKDTPEERTLGLMFRESLDEKEGMLFIFEQPDEYSFWMKNMKISIDIIFLNENKEIVTIHNNVPPCVSESCELYHPSEPALYVVEVKAGFSVRHNLEVSQKVTLDILT